MTRESTLSSPTPAVNVNCRQRRDLGIAGVLGNKVERNAVTSTQARRPETFSSAREAGLPAQPVTETLPVFSTEGGEIVGLLAVEMGDLEVDFWDPGFREAGGMLRDARNAAGLSRAALSKRAPALSKQTVYNAESRGGCQLSTLENAAVGMSVLVSFDGHERVWRWSPRGW